jgi:hypothetical protein
MIGQAWESVWLVRIMLAGLGLPLLVVAYQWAQHARLFEHEPVLVPARHRGARPSRFDAA